MSGPEPFPSLPVLFGPETITVEFSVPGLPVSQGSHTGYVRALFVAVKSRVRCPKCGVPLRGSVSIVDKTVGLDEWRARVSQVAGLAMRGRAPMHGPLTGSMDFAVSRPKAHYRTGKYADRLRDDAPAEPEFKPDLSKLLRAAEDGMTGIVWADDCQVTEYARQGNVPALRMHYAGEKHDGLTVPGVRIVVSQSG